MSSKYLDEAYIQKPSNIDEWIKHLNQTNWTHADILNGIHIFVVSSSGYDRGSYIWVNKPITIQKVDPSDNQFELDPSDEPEFHISLVGWEISDSRAISIWSDTTYQDNVQVILETLHRTNIPFRLDKNEAIREANDINFLIHEVGRSTNNPKNLTLTTWTLYEILQHIKPTMPVNLE